MSRELPRHRVGGESTPSTDHRVNLYSVAAAAAGVSTLALAQPALGEVVITNKTIPVPTCFALTPCPVSIDLNGDGVEDFQFQLTSNYASLQNAPAHYGHTDRLTVKPVKAGGGVVGVAGGAHGPYASCLLRGAKIGASDHFLTKADTVEESNFFSFSTIYSRTLFGKWGGNHPNRFLGVKFLIKGATHYGWVRLTVSTTGRGSISGTITEYGYETVANKSLSAGLTGADLLGEQAQSAHGLDGQSLGMLALGADGLDLWKRESPIP